MEFPISNKLRTHLNWRLECLEHAGLTAEIKPLFTELMRCAANGLAELKPGKGGDLRWEDEQASWQRRSVQACDSHRIGAQEAKAAFYRKGRDQAARQTC